MRKQRLVNNTLTALVWQITSIVCAFILPRLILSYYGSEINGLVNSITQFISVISFLDLGVGAVFQSSLYSPLANGDNNRLSQLYASGQRFFTRLGQILVVYIIVLSFVYPFLIDDSFSFGFTASLIVIISISSFAQYFFGMANGLLIIAAQRGYVFNILQIVSIVLNTICCYVLIKLGASIHIVKLSTSLIFLLRPLLIQLYVNKTFSIIKNVQIVGEPIKQKWNGLAQHIASVILESTDSIVLTVFSSLSAVSIYSVYYLVISGIRQLFNSITNGIQALIGELYAKGEKETLLLTFAWTEWLIHTIATLIFGCTLTLIVPFVLVYTKGIEDANYDQPIFSCLIVLAYLMYTYRLPYHITIKAAVHYKETQSCYVIGALLNIGISVITVWKFGLIGVAVGTLAAMSYQTIWMAYYNSKNIVRWPFKNFLKQIGVDFITIISGSILTSMVPVVPKDYFNWVKDAAVVFIIWLLLVIVMNFIFYNKKMIECCDKIKDKMFV